MNKFFDKKKITVTSICGVVFLILALIISSTVFNKKGDDPVGRTTGFLSGEGDIACNIDVAGVKLKVYQNTGSGYEDVTKTGFNMVYSSFATDKTYNYDLILRNDESADVTADQYYLRWWFTANIDGQEYDITDYCSVDTAYVYKQKDSDGQTRFYSVNGVYSNVIAVQNQLAFLSKIKFKGTYDAESDTYGSVLDKEASGSKITLTAHVEGSLEAYTVNVPSVKFYDVNGSIFHEETLNGGGGISLLYHKMCQHLV